MEHSLISVIIPCYNGEKYIAKTLNSVLQQTYSNWECIIINDGSTDGSELEIQTFIKEDSRFKYYTQSNRGLSKTRNNGLENASGHFIYFLDADDLIPNDALKELFNLLKPEIDIVYGKTALTNGHNFKDYDFLAHTLNSKTVFTNEKKSLIPLIIENPLICIACNRLYRKSFLDKNTLRFKNDILHEDELWHFETLYYSNKIILSDQTTYYYNRNNTESITSNFGVKNTTSYLFIIDYLYTNYYLNNAHETHKNSIAIYITYLKIITIIHAYKQTPNSIKFEVEPFIIEAFKTVTPEFENNLLSKKTNNTYRKFNTVSKLHPKDILIFLKLDRSNSIIKTLKKYPLLLKGILKTK